MCLFFFLTKRRCVLYNGDVIGNDSAVVWRTCFVEAILTSRERAFCSFKVVRFCRGMQAERLRRFAKIMKSLRDKGFESQALGKDVEKGVFQRNHGKH